MRHDAEMGEATLRLTRVRSGWRDRAQKYTILLDGEAVGVIANGETRSIPVSEGEHTLRLKIDWTGSSEQRFVASAGETIAFTCRTDTKFALWALAESVFHRDRWVILERS